MQDGILSTHDGNGIHPEEILNVLREEEELVLGTGTIAEEVGLTKEGVRPHLHAFREEGRVIHQNIGGNDVWGLAPDEPQEPIPPHFDRLTHVTKGLREFFEETKFVGIAFMILGATTILAAITDPLAASLSPWITDGNLVILGAGIAATGGFSWFLGGGLISLTKLLERVVKFRSDERGEIAPFEGEFSRNRGEGPLWFIVAGFLLLILAPVLLKVAGGLYSTLLQTGAFGPLSAFVIVGLLVIGIFLRALGIE